MSNKRQPSESNEHQTPTGTGRAFTWGALLGGIVAAIVTIWKAPRSGSEMRQMIMGRGQDIQREVDRVRKQIEGEPIRDLLDEGKARARKLNRRD